MNRALIVVALVVVLLPCAAAAADWIDVLRPVGELQIRTVFGRSTYEALGLDDRRWSDVYVQRAALGLSANYDDTISGLAQAFYEDGRTDALELEQAWIKARWRGPFAAFGMMYLPYGALRTFGVEEPIVRQMTRARRTAAAVGWENRWLDLRACAFNGELDEADQENDLIDGLSAGLSVRPLFIFEGVELELGGFYQSDALETDELFNELIDERSSPYRQQTPGYGAYVWGRVDALNFLGVGFGGQYVTTAEFEPADYVNARGEKTAVWALDAELALFLFRSMRLAGRYETIEGWDFLAGAGAPDVRPTGFRRYGGALGCTALEGKLDVALEYLTGEDFAGDRQDLAQFNVRLEF